MNLTKKDYIKTDTSINWNVSKRSYRYDYFDKDNHINITILFHNDLDNTRRYEIQVNVDGEYFECDYTHHSFGIPMSIKHKDTIVIERSPFKTAMNIFDVVSRDKERGSDEN